MVWDQKASAGLYGFLHSQCSAMEICDSGVVLMFSYHSLLEWDVVD